MKKILKTSFALTLAMLILALSCLSAFAASDTLKVNGAKAKVGSKLTYSLNLADCTEKVEGLQMYVVYDDEYLRTNDDSVSFPKLSGVVSNAKLENTISFNWTDVSKLADFSKKGTVVNVDFEVLKGGDTDVTFFVSELYGHDLTYLKSFTFTNDIAVDGKTVVKDAQAIVCTDGDIINNYQGSFVNYDDAKGEKNGGKEHESIVGDTSARSTQAATDVTKGSAPDITTIITILVIAAIVIAIIIIAVLRRHFTKSDSKKK